MNHTKEPWDIVQPGPWKDSWRIFSGNIYIGVTSNSDYTDEQNKANARRIVACVNACAGIDTDKLEDRPHPIKDDLDYLARKSEEYIKDSHDQYGFLEKITKVEQALESSGITAEKCGRDISKGIRILTAQSDELLERLKREHATMPGYHDEEHCLVCALIKRIAHV